MGDRVLLVTGPPAAAPQRPSCDTHAYTIIAEAVEDGKPAGRSVRCPVCSGEFPPEGIQRHVNGCLDDVRDPVPCPVCGAAFSSAEAVDLHVSCDHEILPFECPICFEGKGRVGIAACCQQELCTECAVRPLHGCPFCRAKQWRWKPAAPNQPNNEEGCGCFSLLFHICSLFRCLFFRKRKK